MILTSICAPALIYIGFSLIQIFIDIYKLTRNYKLFNIRNI